MHSPLSPQQPQHLGPQPESAYAHDLHPVHTSHAYSPFHSLIAKRRSYDALNVDPDVGAYMQYRNLVDSAIAHPEFGSMGRSNFERWGFSRSLGIDEELGVQ